MISLATKMTPEVMQAMAQMRRQELRREKKYWNLAQVFKTEVCKKKRWIDPEQEQDWYSLSLGWAIAKGLVIKDAHEFSLYVRYDLQYFHKKGKHATRRTSST